MTADIIAPPRSQQLGFDWRVIRVGVFTVFATFLSFLAFGLIEGAGDGFLGALLMGAVVSLVICAVCLLPSLAVYFMLRRGLRRVSALSNLWIDRIACGSVALIGGLIVPAYLFGGFNAEPVAIILFVVMPVVWAVLAAGFVLHPKHIGPTYKKQRHD